MTVTQLASFDPSAGSGSFDTQQKQYKLLVYNWSKYSLVFTATSGNAYKIPAKTRRRIYLDELDGKISWTATSILSSGVNTVEMEIFQQGDCLPYDDLEDLSSASSPSGNFWQGDVANVDIGSNGNTPLLTLYISTTGGTATVNISGVATVANTLVHHNLQAFLDGSPFSFLTAAFPDAGGAASNSTSIALSAGTHTIQLIYFTQALGTLGQHDTVNSAHIDVTVN